jgi:hypothetical protein
MIACHNHDATTTEITQFIFGQPLSVRDPDVIALARGLSILIPDLIGVDNDKIIVNASPNHIAGAIRTQLEALHTAAVGTEILQ